MADKTQRSFEKEYLEKRCETLGQFLDCICESETLRSSIHVLSFLKCTDEDQWNKIKDELEKNQKKTSGLRETFSKKVFEGKHGLKVEDFENLHGDIQCRITGSLKDYSNELDELIKVSEPLYQKYFASHLGS
jgi:PX domain